ncbi:hypothetical protein BV20DRAFT_461270 [Pilatotrama ljubarskyi]|nr:hypothetical protein BV20DRAFT_461270 [Pilatotrama ljubarskyi]
MLPRSVARYHDNTTHRGTLHDLECLHCVQLLASALLCNLGATRAVLSPQDPDMSNPLIVHARAEVASVQTLPLPPSD